MVILSTYLRRYWALFLGIIHAQRSPQEIFSRVYRKGIWGSSGAVFFSGAGSIDSELVEPYIDMVREFAKEQKVNTLIDLGCGDFRVGRQLAGDLPNIIGVDVVPELIESLQAESWPPCVLFKCLDLAADPLPAGDMCTLRQVLQHLSNAQIIKILEKLSQYRYVFITEHYPSDDANSTPNLDIHTGGAIRLLWNSGVYLDQEPFLMPDFDISLVLERPVTNMHRPGRDQGVLKTFKLVRRT